MDKRKILVVDDEKRIVTLVSDFLKAANYDVIACYDGKEALDKFCKIKNEVSLAVIDIMIPEMDGWTLTQEIRKISQVPIIMLSARSEEFDLLESFDMGQMNMLQSHFLWQFLLKE